MDFVGFWFRSLVTRYTTELEGVVVSSRDMPANRESRYATEYVVREDGGHETHYVAGASDASLERSIPVGSRIEKKWGQLGCRLNGHWRSFLIASYSAIMGAAFFTPFWPVLVQWRARR
jgi:hypothetical protein